MCYFLGVFLIVLLCVQFYVQPSRSDFLSTLQIKLILILFELETFWLCLILSGSWVLPQCFVLNILASSEPFVCLYSLLCRRAHSCCVTLSFTFPCSALTRAVLIFVLSVSCRYFKLKCFHILSPPALWKLEVKTTETRCRDASVGKSVPVRSKMKPPPVFPLK